MNSVVRVVSGGLVVTLLSLSGCGGPTIKDTCDELAADYESGMNVLDAYGTELADIGAEVGSTGSWTGEDAVVDRISERLSEIEADAPDEIAHPLRTLVEVIREIRNIQPSDSGDIIGDISERLEALNHELDRGTNALKKIKSVCPDD